MGDYLNILINDPDSFMLLIRQMTKENRFNVLNSRYYDAYDGTLLHLVAYGVVFPSNRFSFDDETGVRLCNAMIENGACPMIEDGNRQLPHEVFINNVTNPGDYKTLRYLLARANESVLEGSCQRHYYNIENLKY